MLDKKSIAWATGLAVCLMMGLSFWMTVQQSIKITLTAYFILYLPGLLFLRNFHKSENVLEQNSLSIIAGITLISIGSYFIKLLKIPQSETSLLILAGIIIAGSLFWKHVKKLVN